MKIKKVLVYCMTLVMVCTVLSGCSKDGVSKEAKKLYNEQIEEYEKRAEYLKTCLSEEEPTTAITFGYPTSFFHLTVDEREIYEEADFGEEMSENLKKGEEISNDAELLNNSFPSASFGSSATQEEYDSFMAIFNELKEKYKDYDYTLKSYE